MKTKILAFTTNPTIGLTPYLRRLMFGDIRYLLPEKHGLKSKDFFFAGKQAPMLISTVLGNNLELTLEKLKDIETPLVVELILSSSEHPDYKTDELRNIARNLDFIKRISNESNWPYVLLIGLSLDSCRNYIDVAYHIEEITRIAEFDRPVEYVNRISDAIRINCIHQKAIIN